jgi:hypothetical protein
MSTIQPGKLGGQYAVSLVTDDVYKVAGLLHGELRTIWKGEYEFATKLMSYCAEHDDEAQNAIHQMYFEADPTPLTELFDHARENREARPRKRVAVLVEVETDVLESENAIENVSTRIATALGYVGLTAVKLECFYKSTPAASPIIAREKLVRPAQMTTGPNNA